MKRHARTRPDSGRLLWVGSDEDWAAMRSRQAPILICPQPGCSDVLHPVQNRRGTRFLRRSATTHGGGAPCQHWWTRSGATGPESARHLWLKARLTSMCLQLGCRAVPEDPGTHADVWLPAARTALEVQLRRTDTLARTVDRLQAGALQVVWFIAGDVPASRMLFRSPAVRFAVVDAWGTVCEPWSGQAQRPRVIVYGTVWRWRDWRLTTGWMSARAFLAGVLAGELGWYPPGTPGFPGGRGGWVRYHDLVLAAGMVPDAEPCGLPTLASRDWFAAELQRRGRRRP